MKCDACSKSTKINYGDAFTVLCEECFDSESSKELLETGQATRKKGNGFDSSSKKKETWGSRIRCSLLIGLCLSIFWMVIVVMSGVHNPSSANGLANILAGAFGIFSFFTIGFFVYSALKHAIRNMVKNKIN